MKISLNWLNEYVDLSDIKIEDIVSKFSLTTAEIEGYEHRGKNISKVVVGEIKTHEKVPNRDKLSDLTVTDGKQTLRVVCGAPNCRVGMKVVWAKPGSQIGDLKVSKATVGGIESHGMLLSGLELGITADHDGIIDLDENVPLGKSITDVLPDIIDTIIEIDNKSLTNRPDLWGHYGIARELSVIFNRPLKPMPTCDLTPYENLPKVPIEIENKTDCLSYGAIRINDITRKSSPLQIQIRLFYLDINPHNFLVDLTNYVMLETAQPTHAFDANKVGKISIGNMPDKTPFTTLKDQQISATPQMLFIKSDGNPVALAGVIGGKNSQIDDTTKDCVFEIATFDATSVRKTAQTISTRTDASARYEKSLDTNLNQIATERLIELIKTHDKDAKIASAFTREVTQETTSTKIVVNKAYAEKFCGVAFDWFMVTARLAKLGFSPMMADEEIRVTVPTWRATKDITGPADVIEEIVRTFGYDNIIPTAPKADVNTVQRLPMLELVKEIKNSLAYKHGLNEVHTYLWSETPSDLRVLSSAVKGCDWIRKTMSPSLLGLMQKNRANHSNIGIFEIGQVYTKEKGEQKHLCLALSSKNTTAEALYKQIAHIITDTLYNCGYNASFKLGKAKPDSLHPKNNALILIDNTVVGEIGIVVDKNPTTIAEISLESFTKLPKLQTLFPKPSKYQQNHLDFTFETNKVYEEIKSIFSKFTHPLNQGFTLKDIYENKFTLQFTIGAADRTLTSEDINDIWSKIIAFGQKNALTLSN